MSTLSKITSLAVKQQEISKARAIAKAAAQLLTKLGVPTRVVHGPRRKPGAQAAAHPGGSAARGSALTPSSSGRRRVSRDEAGNPYVADEVEYDGPFGMDEAQFEADGQSPFIGDFAAR